MMLNTASLLATVLAMSSTSVSAPTNQTQPSTELSKTTRLRMADRYVPHRTCKARKSSKTNLDFCSAAERYSILSDDKDFVFDLGQNNFQSIANRQTFPAMVGTGTSIAAATFPGASSNT